MPAKSVEWITIDDFRPGIFQRVSHRNPPGAAVEEGTYGCKSNNEGNLIPGPSNSDNYTIDDIAVAEPDGDPLIGGLYYVVGLQIVNPVFDDNTVTGINQNNSELFVAFDYITTGGDRHRQLQRFLRHGDLSWEQIYNETDVAFGAWTSAYKPARATMGVTRSNSAAPLESGPSILVACQGDGVLRSFPDDTTPSVTSTVNLTVPAPGNPQPDMIAVHQGRVIAFPLTLTGFGDPGDLVVYAHNECMYWFEVNDVTTMDPLLSGNFFKVLFGYETPAGYDMAVSLSSNEFFLLKRYGGAVLVRGDLNHPQSINLPNVKSPGFAESWGVQTPIGFIYCVEQDGIYAWKGGDTSELISQPLNDGFWRSDHEQPLGPGVNIYRAGTKCCLWGDLIVVPNGWYQDLSTAGEGGSGWWRLADYTTDPTFVAFHNDADWNGRWLYQTPWAIRHGEEDTVLKEWDKFLPNTSYAWKSHPLAQSIDRQLNVREVVAIVSGHGRVNITVSGRTEDDGTGLHTDDAQEIVVDSDFPIAVRRNVAVKGALIQVALTSTEDNGEGGTEGFGAPVIHAINLGVNPRELIGKQESVVITP